MWEHVKLYDKSITDMVIDIPEIQRTIDAEHVKQIMIFQQAYWNDHKRYCISGVISIAIDAKTGIEYLIDGQHRFLAFKHLADSYPERSLVVTIDQYTYTDGHSELEELYQLVNICKPNDIAVMSLNVYKILGDIEKYLIGEFSTYIKSSKSPHRPNINFTSIKEYILSNSVIDKLELTNAGEFIDLFIDLNRYYATNIATHHTLWHVKDYYKVIERINSLPNRLYIGLWNNYEWIDRIVDSKVLGLSWDKLVHVSNGYRPKIPVSLRKQVWGSDKLEGQCYCCKDDINYDIFECGHIIPIAHGGLTNITNLKPICRSCNNDMKTMNMNDYKNLLYLNSTDQN